jgi:hypothetical protein
VLYFVCFPLVYLVLPVSLDCSCLIAPLVFSKVNNSLQIVSDPLSLNLFLTLKITA